jgi:MFS family permease
MTDATTTVSTAGEGPTLAGEFATRWPVLLGAMLGIGIGIIALPGPAIGVFMRALQGEFGWSRAEISLGPTIMIATLALTAPVLGWIADRVSAVIITTVSLAALAVALFLFSRLGSDLRLYYVGFASMALTACGAATLVYARVVSANFVRGRGLALGLAMIGNGLTGILLPILLVPFAASAGWRSGFIVLAVLVAVFTPVVGFLMSRSRPQRVLSADAEDTQARAGKAFGEALREPTFWIMVVVFAIIPLAASGMFLHFLAFLSDAGVDPKQAGWIASLSGVALIVGRVSTGWLIDRAFAPHVAAVMMLISAACIACLAIFGAPAAVLGAVAIGLSIGAELDLIGYMTARYFGMRAFGRVYGLLYAAVLVGSASSPVAYGAVFDATHSYTAGLYVAAALLAVSAGLFMTLRQFPPLEAGAANP